MNLINNDENGTFSKTKALHNLAKEIIEQDKFETDQDMSVDFVFDLNQ